MKGHQPILRILGAIAASVMAALLMSSHPTSNRQSASSTSAPALSGTTAADASQGREPGQGNPRTSAFEAPGRAGMVVGIDPETGRLGMPTPEQRAELEQMSASERTLLSRSAAGLVEERRADGTVHVNLEGRFQEYATVQIGPDGRKTFQCVDDSSGYGRATKSKPPSAPTLEER